MLHEEHSTTPSTKYPANTNPFGILLVVIVAVFFMIFCWDIFKDGTKEINHYRMNQMVSADHEGHGEAEGPLGEGHQSTEMVAPAADSSANDSARTITPPTDSTVATPAADSGHVEKPE